MYKLPEDIELRSLLQRKIVLICCSANQVVFHLDDNASIVAEAPFSYSIDGEHVRAVNVPLSDGSVFELLDHKVIGIEALDARRTLVLRFSNGHFLRFSSDSHYESFHLDIEGKKFIV